jgi:hypothetical protein
MTTEIDLPPPAATANRVGQATAIEQSRAVAEVQASVVLAAQRPRDQQAAIRAMRESARIKRLAERAFYRYRRGEENITGPSIHLARELARIWGNVSYGINELERDDGHGQSVMLAWAWDLETNVRPSQSFIVPHKRDTKKGVKILVDLRDVYENNSNNGARRLRQQIWAVLPPWFVEEAEDLCAQTLRDGGGVPLGKRISNAVERFAAGPKVRVEALERRVGRPAGKWDEYDLAQLQVIYRSLERGEIRVEDEFSESPVTAEEITGGPVAAPAAKPAGKPATAAGKPPVAGKDEDLPEPNEDWAPQDGGSPS